MYSTCLYCNGTLGANEVIETFPVGRRLAFDQSKGRLWVVCRKCEKWNLSPIEERWEAIEDCERRFRDARKRVSTDNIGLARVSEGLELVRIGEPERPEFAAWRYGDQFGRRRNRAIMLGVGAGIVGGGILIAGGLAGAIGSGGYGTFQSVGWLIELTRKKRRLAVITGPDGERLTVRGEHADRSKLVVMASTPGVLSLELHHSGGTTMLDGDVARRATALIMPKVNAGGAKREVVRTAVSRIESSGDPQRFLDWVARNPPTQEPSAWKRWPKPRPNGIGQLDLQTRLAIEMAVNEENERAALEGELALLAMEWKEAEEIAGIADTLTTSVEIDSALQALKRGTNQD